NAPRTRRFWPISRARRRSRHCGPRWARPSSPRPAAETGALQGGGRRIRLNSALTKKDCMKEHRHTRARERKTHLSPDAERMVAAALGLANSGSRIEDRYWEALLVGRIERLLDSGHVQAVYDALDRLHQTDNEAYGALIEAVEEAAETVSIEHEGQRWSLLLVAAPLVVWTRFRIPSGAVPADAGRAIAAHWQSHVLAREARFQLSPYLYSIDQLPRDFGE